MDALRPITMQDIRLRAGEGKLDAATVLAACNAEIAVRVARAIAQAHAAGRAEGLTIAADIARKSVDCCRAQGSMAADREFVGAAQEAADIEAAIRARITTPVGEGA